MKKKAILAAALLLAFAVTGCASVQHQQKTMAEKMIRLHVVANSDSEDDQRIKLQVRDAVLACVESADLTKNPTVQQMQALLAEMEAAAEACLQKAQISYHARAEFLWEDYPERAYDTFCLPAGLWRSLRVTLGEGEGHNWWCVVFPNLCTAGLPEAWQAEAKRGALTTRDVRLMTQKYGTPAVKFRVLELLQALKQRVFS